jgi:tetratricopeptide (TPR) repeat protein
VTIQDMIRSGDKTRANLVFPDGSLFRLKSNTVLTLVSGGVKLKVGELWFNLRKQGKRFRVVTPTTVCGVLGTSGIVTTTSDGVTIVKLVKGKLEVSNQAGKGRIILKSGQLTVVPPCGVPTPPCSFDPAKLIESVPKLRPVASGAGRTIRPSKIVAPASQAIRWYKEGLNAIRAKQYPKAVDLLSRALKAGKLGKRKTASAYYQRGWARSRLGQTSQALKDVEQAIKTNPEVSVYHHMRGWFLMKQKRYQEALKECHTALRLNPKNPFAYHTLSRTHEEMDHCQKAVKYARKALSLRQKSKTLRDNLSRVEKKCAKAVSAGSGVDISGVWRHGPQGQTWSFSSKSNGRYVAVEKGYGNARGEAVVSGSKLTIKYSYNSQGKKYSGVYKLTLNKQGNKASGTWQDNKPANGSASMTKISGPAGGTNDVKFTGTWTRSQSGKVIEVIEIIRKGPDYKASFKEGFDKPVNSTAGGRIIKGVLSLTSRNLTTGKRRRITIAVSGNKMDYTSTDLDGSHPWKGGFVRHKSQVVKPAKPKAPARPSAPAKPVGQAQTGKSPVPGVCYAAEHADSGQVLDLKLGMAMDEVKKRHQVMPYTRDDYRLWEDKHPCLAHYSYGLSYSGVKKKDSSFAATFRVDEKQPHKPVWKIQAKIVCGTGIELSRRLFAWYAERYGPPLKKVNKMDGMQNLGSLRIPMEYWHIWHLKGKNGQPPLYLEIKRRNSFEYYTITLKTLQKP